jgi:hypothetical protein
LLRFFRTGAVPPFASAIEQARVLRPLARFLELEGWTISTESSGAMRCVGPKSMTVGVYPALLAVDAAENGHPTTSSGDAPRVILPDYLIEHDLPSAYQRATGLSAASSGSGARPVRSPSTGRVVELAVKEHRRADEANTHGTVRILANGDPDNHAFAVRVPSPGIRNAGYIAGGWLVVRPVSPADFGSNAWVIVLRARGRFGATAADWTIAHVKELAGDESVAPRVQLSYGSATGKEFRPERLSREEVTLAATIVCHADEIV